MPHVSKSKSWLETLLTCHMTGVRQPPKIPCSPISSICQETVTIDVNQHYPVAQMYRLQGALKLHTLGTTHQNCTESAILKTWKSSEVLTSVFRIWKKKTNMNFSNLAGRFSCQISSKHPVNITSWLSNLLLPHLRLNNGSSKYQLNLATIWSRLPHFSGPRHCYHTNCKLHCHLTN